MEIEESLFSYLPLWQMSYSDDEKNYIWLMGGIDDGGIALAEALSGPCRDARIVAVGLLGLASLGEGLEYK